MAIVEVVDGIEDPDDGFNSRSQILRFHRQAPAQPARQNPPKSVLALCIPVCITFIVGNGTMMGIDSLIPRFPASLPDSLVSTRTAHTAQVSKAEDGGRGADRAKDSQGDTLSFSSSAGDTYGGWSWEGVD
ncbi:hypothetical protein JX266_007838 [Neoarthrinium moseri]|uniref:uncharacterized protein n=1 Tax=Neoarthrinium moseri TaxID=1658444 RepID=UPI001FDE2BE5|nr:uncharacterized protein JN550_004775 [Neoarthrinium moseri]KAI1846029.1 hypothetical protein JX266_007838 [Neoarthrinium moseri]KAI1871330.1 hypothetical protein JN550_004775 [Neoarthrinium moseri]